MLILAGAALVQACAPPPPAEAAPADRWLGYEGRLRRLLAMPAFGDMEKASASLTVLTNRYRARQGQAPLADHPTLALVARAHAADMAARDYFAHDTPEGFTPNDRVGLLARRLCGSTGENLAYRRGGARPHAAASLLEGWIGSPGHRANLVRPEYDSVGHAVVRVDDTTYAAAVFAREAALLPHNLPLRLPDSAALSPVLIQARPALSQFEVSQPQAEEADGPWPSARPPRLPRGAWRLRPLLPQGDRRFSILWGPIFVIA